MRVTGKVTGLDPIKKQIALFPKELQRPMDKLLIQEMPLPQPPAPLEPEKNWFSRFFDDE